MQKPTLFLLLLAVPSPGLTAEFDANAEATSNLQFQLDGIALKIAYDTDFQKKISPGLYLSQASDGILELYNGADFMLKSTEQRSSYALVAYLCFTEPTTDGCEHFNDLGCESIDNDCNAPSSRSKSELASLCTTTTGGKKTVQDDCFIVSLRETEDGASRDAIAPWNDVVQDWVDSHNCSSLMYHLKYRCYATLIKWNDKLAEEEYVDLDKLFDAAFGITAVASFNGEEPLECGSLTSNDRSTLKEAAQLHVENALLDFITTAASLARFGLSAANVMYTTTKEPMLFLEDKLRAVLLVNVFYDGAVQPFREWCCAENLCYDFHPMDVFVDKVAALNTFYPGGLVGLASQAQAFANAPDIGKVHPSTKLPITTSDVYVYNVLRSAPATAAWQSATSAELNNIEAF